MKTTNELVVELTETITKGNATLTELHKALKDTKTFYKHEHDRAEQVLREETAKAIAAISEDVRAYLVAEVDRVVDEFRARLLGE